jgi:hypothetical protein
VGSQTFCASACFTIPTGVTKLYVQAYGGGGPGGAGFFCPCSGPIFGAGGGGGGYGAGVVPVTPGAAYRVTVGCATFGVCGESSFTGNCSQLGRGTPRLVSRPVALDRVVGVPADMGAWALVPPVARGEGAQVPVSRLAAAAGADSVMAVLAHTGA